MRRTKRHIILFMLIGYSSLLGSQAMAWSPVTTDSLGNQYFLDTDSMTRKGYLVYVWQLQNLAQRNDQGALSVRSQMEFDCRFKQSRVMWLTLHTEPNEGGATLSSDAVALPQWSPAQPGDVVGTLIDYACRRIMR
jgi:hypothetical protein